MKNKFNLTIISFIVSFICSCSGKFKTADEGYYFQDFDNSKMWVRDQQISDEQAHSGNFSTYTDSTHEFSQTFEMDLSYAKSKGYKSLHLSAWCYIISVNTKAGLTVSVESSEGNSVYQGVDFSNAISRPHEWIQVNAFLKLPEKGHEGSKIKIYVWAPQKQKTFLDDVEIQFEK